MMDVNFLANINLFSMLSRNELEELAALWTLVRKDKDQTIFKRGDSDGTMYLIYEGAVSMSITTENGESLTLANMRKSDLFGELSLFDRAPRTASAIALEKTELLEITHDKFLAFLKNHPEVSIAMLAMLAKRLRETNVMMEGHVARNANVEMEKELTFGEKLSDKFSEFVGSWSFIMTFMVTILIWVVLNTIELLFHAPDPYPYLLLTLFLSLIAAFQAPIIMMSQNRQAKKDRLLAEIDYKVNLKSEI